MRWTLLILGLLSAGCVSHGGYAERDVVYIDDPYCEPAYPYAYRHDHYDHSRPAWGDHHRRTDRRILDQHQPITRGPRTSAGQEPPRPQVAPARTIEVPKTTPPKLASEQAKQPPLLDRKPAPIPQANVRHPVRTDAGPARRYPPRE